jgi:membrane protein required for beta-lactamase induction
VPLLVLLAVVFPVAAVALLLWFILSLLIGGPVLLVASMMGVSLWGWEWIAYGFIKFIDQRYLGGMLARFWLPQGQSQTEDKNHQEEVQTPEVKSDS